MSEDIVDNFRNKYCKQSMISVLLKAGHRLDEILTAATRRLCRTLLEGLSNPQFREMFLQGISFILYQVLPQDVNTGSGFQRGDVMAINQRRLF